jgi:hypothetical protein
VAQEVTVDSLMTSLAERGIELIPHGRNGVIAKPASKLTNDDRRAICAHGRELLAYLRARQVTRWCEDHHLDAAIGAAILEIERKALSLGWEYERLWNPDFWPHNTERPRGLASVLSPGDELVEVTRDFIVINKTDDRRQRFMRLDS